jgi:hypothetical protein
MANTQAYFGFRQYQGTGSAPTYEQIAVSVAYNASAIYNGDPVTPQTDGTVARSASTGATPGVPGIAGIFVGCQYLSVAQKRTVWSNYWPGSDVASTNTVTGYIINDPNAKFVAQSDATGIAAGDVGSTIGFAIGSGNASNGISGAYLDTTTINTATYNVYAPFKIVSVITDPPGSQGTIGNGQPYDYAVVAFNYVATKNFVGI